MSPAASAERQGRGLPHAICASSCRRNGPGTMNSGHDAVDEGDCMSLLFWCLQTGVAQPDPHVGARHVAGGDEEC